MRFIGIDVGTGSARAGIFDADGRMLASAKHPIRIWRAPGERVEQSSDDIWNAVAAATRAALADAARVAPGVAETIAGIGFDATCSLVVLDAAGAPLSVDPEGGAGRNVMVWMDHRATGQAARINAGEHEVLRYVGGAISPEMEIPKILWLKEEMPETFAAAGAFMDLADFLTWRATGSAVRSACTVTCKWTYLPHAGGWDAAFLGAIGLGALAEEGFARIGAEVAEIGAPLGQGLSAAAAQDLGLPPGISVGAALIDAHAGGVGTLGGRGPEGTALDPRDQIAAILGTSSCTMTVGDAPVFVPGVWGPYHGAMLPGLWLNEGGQSAFGAALDQLVAMHPAAAAAAARAEAEGRSLYALLEAEAVRLAGDAGRAALLARSVHVVPEVLGNRAPEADPAARAVIAGLGTGADEESLVAWFVAVLCGLGYGLGLIVEAQRAAGMGPKMLVVSGGAARSALLRRILADATGCEVALPAAEEPVLLGAAMLGMVASGRCASLSEAAAGVARLSEVLVPSGGEVAAFHARKRAVFARLKAADREVRALMVEG
ncbi:FGGY-family carbohydrate kinase [Acidimangrovimonas sediminis]|uniref:FGGY-family carbohydrate kinase n=1 Tax=Acidimangrovimonas sediminis TaxID=2056283 RepID=UPI000C7F9256|nr:FGGY-family carbohydrate kinase [Acidimangrovimonas sediminis]